MGLAVNETSRRYVNDAPTFDLPDVWRSAPGKGQSKQGSGEPLDMEENWDVPRMIDDCIGQAKFVYSELIAAGIAPEQARLVLPMATVTEWIWTGIAHGVHSCLQGTPRAGRSSGNQATWQPRFTGI